MSANMRDRESVWAGIRRDIDALQVIPGEEERPDAPDGGPYCETCRGARIVTAQHVDPGKGILSVTTIRCPDCKDWSNLRPECGLSADQRRRAFDTIQPTPGILEALNACRGWAAKPDGWLVIHGLIDRTGKANVGCGKTHLALAIANHLIAQGRKVTWWYVPELFAQAKRRIGETIGDQDFLDEVTHSPILFLDDLGAVRPTDYTLEALERLANFRYSNRLPTVYTCIGSPEILKSGQPELGIPPFSESIGRRMQDPRICTVVQNRAPQWKP